MEQETQKKEVPCGSQWVPGGSARDHRNVDLDLRAWLSDAHTFPPRFEFAACVLTGVARGAVRSCALGRAADYTDAINHSARRSGCQE